MRLNRSIFNGSWRRALLQLGLAAPLSLAISGCDLTATDQPQTRQEATRFLNQASFGPSEADIATLTDLGYTQWINNQLATASDISFQDYYETRRTELGRAPNVDQIYEAFYTRALVGKAQLRNRVLLALSEIFVVSILDPGILQAPELMAGYLDVLDKGIDSTYRDLLERISKNPAMGRYLTFLSNAKENPIVGNTPDENYAREVMQLFSVGLYQLNGDGTVKLDGNGKPIYTYGMSDVKGLAKVFTGWTRDHGTGVASTDRFKCFYVFTDCDDVIGRYRPMVNYTEYHSTGEKAFLGTTIPAQSSPDPEGDLKIALDTLANHPNTAPFISRQLIQKLVTSNPSPAYVQRVAARFLATGGHLGETVKAILLDTEARDQTSATNLTYGKLREPVLRMTAVLRAFNFTDPALDPSGSQRTASGALSHVTLSMTSDASTSLGQTPFASPSVFNFFRPGYVMPQSSSAQSGLVAPEFQLVNEASVTGYVNFTTQMVTDATLSTPYFGDMLRGPALALSELRIAATSDTALVSLVADRLLGGTISAALSQSIEAVLQTMPVPASDGSAAAVAQLNTVLDQRLRAAILLGAVSPEFLIQR